MFTARTIVGAREANRSTSLRAPSPSQTSRPNYGDAALGIRDALQRIEVEYREMPGLSLTLPQAARLWGLDRSTCEIVLTKLIERRVLKRTLNGTYLLR